MCVRSECYYIKMCLSELKKKNTAVVDRISVEEAYKPQYLTKYDLDLMEQKLKILQNYPKGKKKMNVNNTKFCENSSNS